MGRNKSNCPVLLTGGLFIHLNVSCHTKLYIPLQVKNSGVVTYSTSTGLHYIYFAAVNTMRAGDANLRYNCERKMTQICLLTIAWILRS
jgi:hypothetical protein